MARKATQASLWLPGFDIESPTYPDLFAATEDVATAPSTFNDDAPAPATTQSATVTELPRRWRPTTIPAFASAPSHDHLADEDTMIRLA